MANQQFTEIYELLHKRFADQHWWPGETRFEIIVGAILTQNTNWANVEKAIANLKAASALDPHTMHNMPAPQLAQLIRPSGYFNIKTKRLKNFLAWLIDNHHGDPDAPANTNMHSLREDLLRIKGIGRETADSILLYAYDMPIFVVDTYTARFAVRHHLIDPDAGYEQLQELFQWALPEDVKLFNEYHALIVRLGKQFCKTNPICTNCPLESLPHTIESRDDY